jgi:hypothetical protein
MNDRKGYQVHYYPDNDKFHETWELIRIVDMVSVYTADSIREIECLTEFHVTEFITIV